MSVRQHHSTLCVTLRDASASLSRVTEIAGQFEQVRRDHATGEILCGGNTFVRVEYADALVDPLKAEILAVLDPAPNDEYIALPGGFRACKVSSQHGATTYVREVRMEGPTFHDRNNIAVGSAGPPSGSPSRAWTPARWRRVPRRERSGDLAIKHGERGRRGDDGVRRSDLFARADRRVGEPWDRGVCRVRRATGAPIEVLLWEVGRYA